MKKINIPILFMATYLFLTGEVWAWNSIAGTHSKIGSDACGIISQEEYPDIKMFRDKIVDGSKTESHNTTGSIDNFDDSLNGGDPGAWWKEAKRLYKEDLQFQKAYFTVGRLCHLIQDQGVPTHAADISHGVLTPRLRDLHLIDKFEAAAVFFYNHGAVSPSRVPSGGEKSPPRYYTELLNETRSKLTSDSWMNPQLKKHYWIYGGDDNTDIYYYELPGASAILRSQIEDSISFTAGALIATSKGFPPIIKDLGITGSPSGCPVIVKGKAQEVRFKVMENRKETVKVFMTVDSKDGPPIISPAYAKGKGVDIKLDKGKDLPWEKEFAISWDGTLANGIFPPPGLHVLYVWAEDVDGNKSRSEQHNFIIEAGVGEISCLPVSTSVSLDEGVVLHVNRSGWKAVFEPLFLVCNEMEIGGSDIYAGKAQMSSSSELWWASGGGPYTEIAEKTTSATCEVELLIAKKDGAYYIAVEFPERDGTFSGKGLLVMPGGETFKSSYSGPETDEEMQIDVSREGGGFFLAKVVSDEKFDYFIFSGRLLGAIPLSIEPIIEAQAIIANSPFAAPLPRYRGYFKIPRRKR